MQFSQATLIALLSAAAAAAPASVTCAQRADVCKAYNTNNGLSTIECTTFLAQCIGACQVDFTRCQTAPDAHHPDCAAALVGCTGVSYELSILPQSATGEPVTQPAPVESCETKDNACRTAPNANQADCSAQKAECSAQCSTEATACRTAPDANQADCSANYAGCLGKNPYTQ